MGEVKILVAHLELLCQYSSRCRAVLQHEEPQSRVLELPGPLSTVEVLLGWLYTDEISTARGSVELAQLYILADQLEIPALREDAFDRTVRELLRHEDLMVFPNPETLALVSAKLPESSSLRRWYLWLTVNHWDTSCDSAESKQYFASLPSEFSSTVLRMQAELHESPPKRCVCCHDLCFFHEHPSEEECLASDCYFCVLMLGGGSIVPG